MGVIRNPKKISYTLDTKWINFYHNNLSKIQNTSKENFASLVKRKIRIAAFENLMKTKASLSKMSSLDYKELKVQDYLKSRDITTTEKKQIFLYRTRMVKNFAVNFKNSATDLSCPLCHSTPDCQNHLLDCKEIVTVMPEISTTEVQYEDIFENDPDKMKNAIKLLDKAMIKRNELLAQPWWG